MRVAFLFFQLPRIHPELMASDTLVFDRCVSVIMHTGKFPIRSALPSRVAGLSALVRILPGSSDYRGTVRHGMMSRNWGPRVAKCSLQLIRVQIVMVRWRKPILGCMAFRFCSWSAGSQRPFSYLTWLVRV